MWELRFERDRFSIEAAKRKGRPLPDWYLECPEVMPGEDFYFRAFWDLDTERKMDLGPIPHSAIANYGDLNGLCSGNIRSLVIIIRRMDGTYRKWVSEQRDKTRKAATGTHGRKEVPARPNMRR